MRGRRVITEPYRSLLGLETQTKVLGTLARAEGCIVDGRRILKLTKREKR